MRQIGTNEEAEDFELKNSRPVVPGGTATKMA